MLSVDSSFNSYLERMGFKGDPFASTNAEQESELSDYFVPPPYFESVLGSPESPKTNMIFAPRGTGKTAQRLMIETTIAKNLLPILCLTYEHFMQVQAKRGSIEAHLLELNTLLTVGVLAKLESDENAGITLTNHEREVVKAAATAFLSKLSTGEYEKAIKSVKNLGDKASELWRKYGGPVAAGLAILMKKAGIDDVSVSVTLQKQITTEPRTSLPYFFTSLLAVAQKLDYRAVYFLVDRVDEISETTSNADAAGKLIFELATSLPTMEAPGVAFKFFLWDQMKPFLVSNGLRPDRMEIVSLGWTPDELSRMLSRRLETFSDRRISSFNQLLSPEGNLDVHELLVRLSDGSPRDMIRMARAIVTEHTRMSGNPDAIARHTALQGIRIFSKEITQERFPKHYGDFLRVGNPSFTIPDAASIFKISSQGATNKIQVWTSAGGVKSLGTKANPGKKPLNLYGFTDFRVVLASASAADMELVLDNYSLQCPRCLTFTITDESDFDCQSCGASVRVGEADSLLALCTVSH